MAYAELIEAAKDLSENNQYEVIDFINYLKSKENRKKVPERKSGLLKGKLKYMADDFDEPLDLFKEYM